MSHVTGSIDLFCYSGTCYNVGP